MTTDTKATERAVTCPVCGRLTTSLKEYRLRIIAFLVIAARVEHSTYTACPACMRAAILRNTFVSILAANVLFPIALVANGIHFIMSYSEGHSFDIKDELRHQDKMDRVRQSVRGDGSLLDQAKQALANNDRKLAFKLASQGAALANNDPADEHTKLMHDIFNNVV